MSLTVEVEDPRDVCIRYHYTHTAFGALSLTTEMTAVLCFGESNGIASLKP